MSTAAKQALVLLVGGLLIGAVILRLARKRLLSTRYAIGWLVIGGMVAVAAALMPFVGRLGRLANMTPTAVLLQERLRTTAEAHALLARRLDELEQRGRV